MAERVQWLTTCTSPKTVAALPHYVALSCSSTL